MLTASAMGYYDKEIEKAVVLALFVPLIISSGGNSGSQAAHFIIRAMATSSNHLKDWWQHWLYKNLYMATSLGFRTPGVHWLYVALSCILIFSSYCIYGEHSPIDDIRLVLKQLKNGILQHHRSNL
ncbi:hypothetical protein FQR65_LT18076 [Abscondita terminalis]|nr:hypothetical protein FQR65_LT18076 [Abscondita terminalis]